MPDPAPSVFISYRRDGGADVARALELFLQMHGFVVFLDVDNLGSGHFDTQLLAQIERCERFVLVCSPGCLDRCAQEQDWVRREIAHALRCGRKIVPVALAGFKWPSRESLPAEIADVAMHNAFEYSHSHWKLTSGRLLEMLGAQPVVRDTIAANAPRPTAAPASQSVEDRMDAARAREHCKQIDGMPKARRGAEIRRFLAASSTLPTDIELRREVVCLRARMALELDDSERGEPIGRELNDPLLMEAPSDEQISLIAQFERCGWSTKASKKTATETAPSTARRARGKSEEESTRARKAKASDGARAAAAENTPDECAEANDPEAEDVDDESIGIEDSEPTRRPRKTASKTSRAATSGKPRPAASPPRRFPVFASMASMLSLVAFVFLLMGASASGPPPHFDLTFVAGFVLAVVSVGFALLGWLSSATLGRGGLRSLLAAIIALLGLLLSSLYIYSK